MSWIRTNGVSPQTQSPRLALLQLQIISVAMPAGAAIFAGVVAFMAFTGISSGHKEATSTDLVQTLSLVVMALMAGSWVVAGVVGMVAGRRWAAQRQNQSNSNPGELTVGFLIQFATVRFLQMAMLEGPSLFGVVVCLLAALDHTLPARSEYWLNLVPGGCFVIWTILTFPTQAKVREAAFGRQWQ